MEKLSKTSSELKTQVQILHRLTGRMSQLESQLIKLTGMLNKIDKILEFVLLIKESQLADFGHEKIAEGSSALSFEFIHPKLNAISGGLSNIIPFPRMDMHTTRAPQTETIRSRPESLLAVPGKSLPGGITDFRPLLQRDGLILLAWDKRTTEMGERFTAYWVTSTGIPRFYASRHLSEKDFFSAWPDHKSYAAEDGIEFYGQDDPDYIVHVAPELMMNNPRHGELRQPHIEMLKHMGSRVDFNYKFLLKTEKKRKQPFKTPSGEASVSRGNPTGFIS